MFTTGSLEDVGVFVRVVESGIFSEAAREIGISKSAASKAVARLEGYLGVRLIHRTTRRMAVTGAGGRFFERCARVVHELERAQRTLRDEDRAPAGTLRVAVPGTFERVRLAPLVPEFLTRYPECQLRVVARTEDSHLAAGAVDLEIRIGGGPVDANLSSFPLARNTLVLCAAPDYLRRAGVPRQPEDLHALTCVSFRELFPDDTWPLLGADGEALRVQAAGPFASGSGEVVRATLLAGLGVSLLPTYLVADDLAAGRLEAVLARFAEEPCPVYAVCRRMDELAGKVGVFVGFLKERFRGRMAWEEGEVESGGVAA